MTPEKLAMKTELDAHVLYAALSYKWILVYLTIIPQARMGYGSIAHEAEGRMGYWLRGHEGERNNPTNWSKKYRDKTSFAS